MNNQAPTTAKARVIAFYLPQFHPIPENDLWWGKGFTEWTNTAKAKPLFKGHYQPHVPADLGFYDLRLPETREAQAALARQYGVEAFCYWHYWFAGKRLLERPFQEVLDSGQPDFPFCLGWANETWSGIWHGNPGRILVEQTYPGEDDFRRHFDFLLRAFTDRRYVRVDGKPLMFIYSPWRIPDCHKVMDFWRELASRAGLPGIQLVGRMDLRHRNYKEYGLDAITIEPLDRTMQCSPMTVGAKLLKLTDGKRGVGRLGQAIYRGPKHVHKYETTLPRLIIPPPPDHQYYPCALPNWDNTPRSGRNGWVLHGSTPELFRRNLRDVIQQTVGKPAQHRIVFLKSWNEWAEGNYVEPDMRFGHGYLQVIKEELAGSGSAE